MGWDWEDCVVGGSMIVGAMVEAWARNADADVGDPTGDLLLGETDDEDVESPTAFLPLFSEISFLPLFSLLEHLPIFALDLLGFGLKFFDSNVSL